MTKRTFNSASGIVSATAMAYRKQLTHLRLWVTALLVGAIVLLCAPSAYRLTLPDKLRPEEQLVIGNVTVPLRCEPTSSLLPAKGWHCGDTIVSITTQPGVADAQLAAQRALRNISLFSYPTGVSASSRDSFLLADAPTGAAALILPAPDEEAGTAFVVTFEGSDAAAVVGPTWYALTGQPLTADLEEELTRFRNDSVSLPQEVHV